MPGPVRSRATTREIRMANRLAILRSVYAVSTPPTRHGIAAQTRLSFPTVAAVVNELLAAGLLVEAGKESPAGGRPRGLLEIAADFGTLVGVDVAETYIQVDVYDAALRPLARHRRELEGPSEPESLLRKVAEAVTTAIDATLADLPPRRNLGVGISLPGQVQAETGVSIFAPNWGWRDVPVERLLDRQLPYPLRLDNPLKAATVAELWFGRGRETGDLVTVNLGTGVGAGLAVDGELLRGTSNNAGEWGHTSLIMNGRSCRCGRSGCVEAYIGVPGLMETFADEFGAGHRYLAPRSQTRFIASVRAGMLDGEPEARWMIDGFAELLGYALANLVNMINPSLVVLTSWVTGQLGRWLIPPTERIMLAESISSSASRIRLVASELTEPVTSGMATLALEHHLADRADDSGPGHSGSSHSGNGLESSLRSARSSTNR